jgi:hypothetical protein
MGELPAEREPVVIDRHDVSKANLVERWMRMGCRSATTQARQPKGRTWRVGMHRIREAFGELRPGIGPVAVLRAPRQCTSDKKAEE